ncbi:polysaccharide deacetylase family protein [Paenibacillus sp. SI8]|uniref:polysaccharide deacetylase family protein n=1 Tax=unclassified Paenibacillus TaxID=185978 RepID=UPI003465D333
MTKRMWFIVIVCLLISGCGVSKMKPYQDQRYAQEPDERTHETTNLLENNPKEESGSTSATPLSPISAPPLSTPAAPPALQASPTPDPVKPAPSPAGKTRLKSTVPSPEPAKKPSVPVQQNQHQVRGAQKRLTLSQLVVKYPETFKLRGSSQEKKVALTFDDGPDTRFTPKVLDVLKANQVKATFFLLGSQSSAYPDIVRRIVKEGHIIGNHSYSHANLPKLTADSFQSQIESTESVLQGLIGYAPKLIRPPYGAINEEQVRWMADHHYLIVNWNVDSLDWKSLKSDQVLHNIMQQMKPGSIILQHSGGADSQDLSGTVQALGPLISKLKAAGYSFVTVPDLLHVAKSK